MASADVNEPVETDSPLHSQYVRLVAGHVSATLDEGTGGDVGAHVPFLPLVDALRDHFGVVNYLGLLAV